MANLAQNWTKLGPFLGPNLVSESNLVVKIGVKFGPIWPGQNGSAGSWGSGQIGVGSNYGPNLAKIFWGKNFLAKIFGPKIFGPKWLGNP